MPIFAIGMRFYRFYVGVALWPLLQSSKKIHIPLATNVDGSSLKSSKYHHSPDLEPKVRI